VYICLSIRDIIVVVFRKSCDKWILLLHVMINDNLINIFLFRGRYYYGMLIYDHHDRRAHSDGDASNDIVAEFVLRVFGPHPPSKRLGPASGA